jgi:hypothetical protein
MVGFVMIEFVQTLFWIFTISGRALKVSVGGGGGGWWVMKVNLVIDFGYILALAKLNKRMGL